MVSLPLLIVKMYNQTIEENTGETTSNYGLIPLMTSTYKFQIGCLNAESNNERMISVGNDVVNEVNIILSVNNIDMLVVLHIHSEFMEFIRSKHGNFPRQKFNVTIVRSGGEE